MRKKKHDSVEVKRLREVLEVLRDALEDVHWLRSHAMGRRTEDDEIVWDILDGMKARIRAALEGK
jgi:hypothetical protein